MRRGYIDWLRGLAVVIMIEAHTIDAWTRPADRELPWFGWAIILGGFGAPLFLFLAGIAVALSASAKVAKGSEVAAARLGDLRPRGSVQTPVLRAQSRVVAAQSAAGGHPQHHGTVDRRGRGALAGYGYTRITGRGYGRIAGHGYTRITRIGHPAAARFCDRDLHRGHNDARRPRAARAGSAAGAARRVPAATAGTHELHPVPLGRVRLCGCLRRRPHRAHGRSNLGSAADPAARSGRRGLALAGYGASYLPSIYARSSFWTSSPTFFFLRTGLLVLALAAAYLWERGPAGRMWSPMQQLGRTSLFIYWIRVEMVYGALSAPIRRQLPFGRAVVAFALFTVAIVGVSLAKTWVVARWRARRTEAPTDSVFRVFRG